MYWRTLNRKTIKFFENKHVRRIVASVGVPLLVFRRFWSTFDGDYTGTEMFWGIAVTITLASAIYLYFPIAKKIERGSIIWFSGLFTTICLFALGSGLMGFWTHWIIVIPVAEKAWGWYISYLAIWMPVIHVAAKKRDKAQDKPREIIPRVIPLFKGPAAWNKAER
ncbi:MAG: hypothetical protein OXI05_02875 [Bacteroidota bacterium]|nr:hypothetical protein [Bacteroidota bacterium]MXW15784.1 hypothetical protein [Rhodothermaceae bacterium]MDE2644770.1 hypothetical protein [Bacteroidota bacterium]MXW32821.1 hypothetical protein [Rhodothermaceae bacterium]MYC03782.1 hypothetical protein [Rhodothermaceae bacterium]